MITSFLVAHFIKIFAYWIGVDRYVFFRADTDYYRSSRPITDILNRYTCRVKMKINAKINNNKSSDKKRSLNAFKHVFNSENC